MLIYTLTGKGTTPKAKETFDPTKQKRTALVDLLLTRFKDEFKDYEIYIGGQTSIEILPKHMNKASSLRKIQTHLMLKKEQILYFGDNFNKYGNDYPILKAKFNVITVKNYKETYKILNRINRNK